MNKKELLPLLILKSAGNICCLFFACLGFLACSARTLDQADPNPPINTSHNALKEYTVMIYLNGDGAESGPNSENTMLNGRASDVLKLLQQSTFDDSKLNVIVTTGGTKNWLIDNPNLIAGRCQTWRIFKNQIELVYDYDSNRSMIQKDVLAENISWVINQYPAKKYALFMWGPGAGPVGGFGRDELNNDASMSIADIHSALETSLGGTTLELIAFSSALMGNFETAYQLKDYAKYMAGSEALPVGNAFGGTIQAVSDNPAISGLDLGKAFINAHFTDPSAAGLYTFSLLDLSKMEEIKTYLNVLIQQLSEKIKSKSSTSANTYLCLATARSFSESYVRQARDTEGLTDMFHFADLITQKCSINTDALKKSIKSAVLYNKVSNIRPHSNGMSLFFLNRKLNENLGLQDKLEKYKSGCFSNTYYSFLSDYYNNLFVWDGGRYIGSLGFFASRDIMTFEPATPPVYQIRLDASSANLVNQPSFVIGRVEEREGGSIFKIHSIEKDTEFNPESGMVSVRFTGKQYGMGGNPVPIYWDNDVTAAKDPGYIPMGQFAVKHNGVTKFLLARENQDKKTAQIFGVCNGESYQGYIVPLMAQCNTTDLPKIGDKITLLYKVLGKYEDGPEIVLEGYSMTKTTLENGDYGVAFYFEDILGRTIWSYRKDISISGDSAIRAVEIGGQPMSGDDTL